jgi:PhzF family phenazine biosynthesis protein
MLAVSGTEAFMQVQRIAAFSDGDTGGNPAGVVLCDRLPEPAAMQALAAEVGYSETAFAAPEGNGWRVRYFAPAMEVPFCGHATIALGAALALRFGAGTYALRLNEAAITVEGRQEGATIAAALQSPPTRSQPAPPALLEAALALFGYAEEELDPRIPPALAEAGARHLVLALTSRQRLAAMRYDQAAGAVLMRDAGLTTISLIHEERARLFNARNPFAAGGVYEDPATGAAAAAFAGYLRDLDWPHGGGVEIVQGEDMGMPSRLQATIPPGPGTGIRVSGTARIL